jgi:hypothetical protein
MKKTQNLSDKAPSPPGPEEKSAPRRAAATESAPSCRLKVRYYSTMRRNKTYPLVIEPASQGGSSVPPGTPAVVVRPIIPGALVVPGEQKVDLARPGGPTTFYVTPLAKGKLPNAHVEVHAAGQPVQEIGLKMRARTQRLTWLLLVLTVGLAWLLNFGCKDPPVGVIYKDGKPTHAFGGPVLAYRVSSSLREVIPPLPSKSDPWITRPTFDAVGQGLGFVYDRIYELYNSDVPVISWITLALLGLTFISWAVHHPWRSRISKAIALPRPAVAEPPTQETLPLGKGPVEPLTVEPI